MTEVPTKVALDTPANLIAPIRPVHVILSMISHYLFFSTDTLWSESTMKAAIELIFSLPATANSNEQIRSLTGVYLRQGTATEKHLEMF